MTLPDCLDFLFPVRSFCVVYEQKLFEFYFSLNPFMPANLASESYHSTTISFSIFLNLSKSEELKHSNRLLILPLLCVCVCVRACVSVAALQA